MTYEPRRVSFLGREGSLKHYGIAFEGDAPRSELACVWELEVIDIERRAWLEDVLKDGDADRYLERALEPVAV